MPIFDFECAACGTTTEILVRPSDPKPRCPSCKSARMKKAFSAPAIITKGAGGAAKVKTTASKRGGCSGKSCGSCSCCG